MSVQSTFNLKENSSTRLGPTYEVAVASGGKAGRSAAFQVSPSSPPIPPVSLIGLQGFSLTSASTSHPPVSSGFGATTPYNQPLLLTYASLLEPISDPDGDPVHIVSIGTNEIRLDGEFLGTVELSTNEAVVLADGARVVYIPKQDFVGADRFSYVVGDPSGLQSTVFAQIAVLAPGVLSNAAQKPAITAGTVSFNFAGLPGKTYRVQRAESLTGPWLDAGTLTVAPDARRVTSSMLPRVVKDSIAPLL